MLYTSVLLRVLAGKGYGVRASEYGPQFRLGTLEQAHILFRNPISRLYRRYKNDNGC